MITDINPNYDIKDELVGYVMEDTPIDKFTNSLKMYIPLIHPLVNGYDKPTEEECYLRMNSSFLNDSGCSIRYNNKFKVRNFINVEKNHTTEFKRDGVSIIDDKGINKVVKKGTKIICKILNGNISDMRFYDVIIKYSAENNDIENISESNTVDMSIPFIRVLTTDNKIINSDAANNLFGESFNESGDLT